MTNLSSSSSVVPRSRRRRRTTMACSAALVVGLSLSACGSSGGKHPAAGSSAALSGSISIITATDVDTALKPIIEAFEAAHPGTKVETQSFPAATVDTTIRARMNAGTPPDIVQARAGYGSGVSSVKSLAGANKLIDLSDQPWVSSLPADVKELDSLNGKVYGYSPELGIYGVVYDKTAWQANGLQVPTTFDALLSLCGQVAAKGLVPIAFGSADTGMIPRLAVPIAAQQVLVKDPKWNQERTAKQVTFANTAGWTNTINMIKQMKDSKCFGPSPSGYTEQQARQNLAAGKALMTFANFGAIKALNPAGDYGLFALPGGSGNAGPYLAVVPSLAFMVPTGADNPTLARAFLAYFAQAANSTAFSKTQGVLPISAVTTKSADALPSGAELLAPLITSGKTTTDPTVDWPNPAVATALIQGIQAMISGQGTSASSILANMDSAWNQTS